MKEITVRFSVEGKTNTNEGKILTYTTLHKYAHTIMTGLESLFPGKKIEILN